MGKQARRFWAAAETGYNSEGIARRSVEGLGHEVYFPQYREKARSGVRRVLPLLDRYLLVRLDRRLDDWLRINSCRGVVGVMRGAHGGDVMSAPAEIPDEKVQWIRSLEGSDGYVVLEDEEPPAFAFQDQVIALKGAFRDQRGEYRGIDAYNPRRAKIAFEILGREVLSSVPRYDLARA